MHAPILAAPFARSPAQTAEALPPSDAAARWIAEILAEGGYQTEPPGASEDASPPDLTWLGDLLVVGGWVLAIVALAGVAIWIAALWRGRGEVDFVAPGGPRTVAAEPVRFRADAVDEAERLAGEGRYGEAIRLLLHLTFEALRGRKGVRLDPWLTGREVVSAARVSEPVRASLGSLVGAVELSLFAGRVPGRGEFDRCADEYRSLLRSAGKEPA